MPEAELRGTEQGCSRADRIVDRIVERGTSSTDDDSHRLYCSMDHLSMWDLSRP